MWFGKLAIISYIWSFCLLAVAGILLHELGWQLYAPATVSDQALGALVDKNNVTGLQKDTTFIFGNFYGGLVALGNIALGTVTGGVTADAINSIPFLSGDPLITTVLIRGILTFSTAMLIIGWVSNREL